MRIGGPPVPTLTTSQQLLDAVNAAILDLIQGGQEVTINGRRYRRAELEQLREMRKELESEVARLESGSNTVRARRVIPIG